MLTFSGSRWPYRLYKSAPIEAVTSRFNTPDEHEVYLGGGSSLFTGRLQRLLRRCVWCNGVYLRNDFSLATE